MICPRWEIFGRIFTRLSTGHDPARASDQEALKKPAGRVGSDPEVVEMSRVGSGRVRYHGVGPGHPGTIIQPARRDLTRLIPQSCQAILTALCWDTALLRPPYYGASSIMCVIQHYIGVPQ